jgi:hypothetical protein
VSIDDIGYINDVALCGQTIIDHHQTLNTDYEDYKAANTISTMKMTTIGCLFILSVLFVVVVYFVVV